MSTENPPKLRRKYIENEYLEFDGTGVYNKIMYTVGSTRRYNRESGESYPRR